MSQEGFLSIGFRPSPILCNAGPSSFGSSTLSVQLELEKETNGYSSVSIYFVPDNGRLQAVDEYDRGSSKEVSVSFPMSMYTGFIDLINSPSPQVSYHPSLEHKGTLAFHGT